MLEIKEALITITKHFGIDNQIEKLKEEQGELIEAIKENDRKHIIEEMADNTVLHAQIALEFDITSDEVNEVFCQKIDRTIERIKTNYYEEKNAR